MQLNGFFQVAAHPTSCVSPRAGILGKVELGPQSSVFAGAQLRGDTAPIVVGACSNIQECAVVHVDAGHPCLIGSHVTVGHGAIVHGCTVGDHCMVGMGATVMTGAVLGEGCLVAAGAVVTQEKVFAPRTMIVGVPGKAVRTLSDEEFERLNQSAWREYLQVSSAMVDQGAMFHPSPGFCGQV